MRLPLHLLFQMKAEIKRLHSPDVYDLKNYRPEKPENFSFLLQVLVGQRRTKGEESFDFIVCTPKWLLSNNNKKNILFGTYHLIVFEYDYENLLSTLKKCIESVEESDWLHLAQKIGRFGQWEFQDYREFKD